MRTLYIHAGIHKTGTTSVQAALRENAGSLRQMGILVPVTGTLSSISGHHNIAWEARVDRRFDPARGTLSELIDEITQSKLPAAVISSEDFEYLVDHPDRIDRMEQQLFSAHIRVTYLVFFRSPISYAVSLYKELLKHGLSISFSKFLKTLSQSGKFSMRDGWVFHLDFETFAKKWRAATNQETVFFDYDLAVADTGVFEKILQTVTDRTAVSDLPKPLKWLNQHPDSLWKWLLEFQARFELRHFERKWNETARIGCRLIPP